MPLINCIDCGNPVSDRAATCPQCGGPMAQAAKRSVPPPAAHVTVEQTNKGLKGETLLAAVMAIVGILLVIMTEGPLMMAGFFGVVGAFGWYLSIRARSWWGHG